MSTSYTQAETAQLWTLEGLAAEFGVSKYTVKHYCDCDVLPKPLGRHPNGFNYDITHYRALARKRAEMESRVPLTRRRKRHPHTVKVYAREVSV